MSCRAWSIGLTGPRVRGARAAGALSAAPAGAEVTGAVEKRKSGGSRGSGCAQAAAASRRVRVSAAAWRLLGQQQFAAVFKGRVVRSETQDVGSVKVMGWIWVFRLVFGFGWLFLCACLVLFCEGIFGVCVC